MKLNIEEKFQWDFGELLKRVEINEIVCSSSEVYENRWSVEDVKAYLEDSCSRNIITASDAMCFYDSKLLQSPTAFTELGAIKEQFDRVYKILDDDVKLMCRDGENIYAVNELMREYIKQIDEAISKMNFKYWWDANDLNNKREVLFLLVGKEKLELRGLQIDIRANCGNLIDYQFKQRELLLYDLKIEMVDIYSRYLVYPDIEKIPSIKHNCTKTEISELIYALLNSDKISDKVPLKTFLLELFSVSSSQYSKAVSDIKERKVGKNKFLEKLLENSDL